MVEDGEVALEAGGLQDVVAILGHDHGIGSSLQKNLGGINPVFLQRKPQVRSQFKIKIVDGLMVDSFTIENSDLHMPSVRKQLFLSVTERVMVNSL